MMLLVLLICTHLLHISDQTATKGFHEKDKIIEKIKTTVYEETIVQEADEEFDKSHDDDLNADDDNDYYEKTSSNWGSELKEIKKSFVTYEQRATDMMKTIQLHHNKIETLYAQISTLSKQIASISEPKKLFTESKNSNIYTAASSPMTDGVANGRGVSYIRWGRTTCNHNSTVLYYGYAATSRWNETGGGSNYLCMPLTPQGAVKSSAYGTRLFGIEYDFHSTPFSAANNRNQSFYYNDMPCAVCYSEYRNHQLMIPAKNTCPIGWTKEYTGYLVSSWYKNTRSNFYCLDGAPEVVPGGSARADTAYAHPVDVQCGPLPCPAYTSGDRVACVICSK